MKQRLIWSNLGIMVLFTLIGLTRFADNVRPVQVIGLFASGAAFGASLVALITALRARRNPKA